MEASGSVFTSIALLVQIRTSKRRTIKQLSTRPPGTAITSWWRCCWRPVQTHEPWTSTAVPPFSISSKWLMSGPWPNPSSAISCCSTTARHGSTHHSSTRCRDVDSLTALWHIIYWWQKVLAGFLCCMMAYCVLFRAGVAVLLWLPRSSRNHGQLLRTLKAHKEVESCHSRWLLQGS